MTRPVVERAFRQDAGETWFDPSALLDVREPPDAGPEAGARAEESSAAAGQEGLLSLFDLASPETLSVVSGDLAIARAAGFRLLGAAPAELQRLIPGLAATPT